MCVWHLKKNSTQFDAYQMFVPKPTQIQRRNGEKKWSCAKRIGNDFEKMYIWHLKNNSAQFDAYQMFVPEPTQIQRRNGKKMGMRERNRK